MANTDPMERGDAAAPQNTGPYRLALIASGGDH